VRDSRFLGVFVLFVLVLLLNLPAPTSIRLKAGASDNLSPFQNGWTVLVSSWGRAVTVLSEASTYTTEKVELEEDLANLRFELQQYEGLEKKYNNLKKGACN